jgi:sorbitol-specific phosphotransferase system component IIC
MLKYSLIALVLLTNVASAQFGMYLAERPKISLEDALPVAIKAARAKIPDLE